MEAHESITQPFYFVSRTKMGCGKLAGIQRGATEMIQGKQRQA